MPQSLAPLALYIHWPFCLSKCPYCDFNSHVRDQLDHATWQDAMLRELAYYAALLPNRQITSIFFGGGTPSLMQPATVAALINAVRDHWVVARDIEIALEANPTSVEADKFAALAAAGVNRVSLGVQSFDNTALKFLGREHDAAQAIAAITIAAQYFPRYSFDLIYAYAGQTMAAWETELRHALTLARGHLSLYQLTIEQNTAFHTRAGHGELLTVAPEASADLFFLTQNIMQTGAMPAYEISNHAMLGHESQHNRTYWQYDDFIGIGAGAHGRYIGADGQRYATVGRKVPEAWAQQVAAQGHGAQSAIVVDNETAQGEALMMGLRITKGIDRAVWQEKFGQDVLDFVPPEKITRLQQEGLLDLSSTHLTTTQDGAAKLNSLLRYLLPDSL